MSTAKEQVRQLLDTLPDDTTLEDIQYHIYVREKIERGRRDVREGKLVSQEEAERRMAKIHGARDLAALWQDRQRNPESPRE